MLYLTKHNNTKFVFFFVLFSFFVSVRYLLKKEMILKKNKQIKIAKVIHLIQQILKITGELEIFPMRNSH